MFASGAADYLGARVRIVGNIGEDYPGRILRWLTHRGLNRSLLRNTESRTTRFRITYRHEARRLWLLEPGRPVESAWNGGPVNGLHLGPVFNEISEPLVRSFRKKCGFMSLDIQGLVRGLNRLGEVRVLRRNIDSMLRLCDLVKGSINETGLQTSTRNQVRILDRFLANGPKYAILTLGSKGSILGMGTNQKFYIPAFPEKRVKDPTGAGDVYMGAWVASYLRTKDPVWAASVGSAFASLALQRTGLSKFRISRRELFCRTSWVYYNTRRL